MSIKQYKLVEKQRQKFRRIAGEQLGARELKAGPMLKPLAVAFARKQLKSGTIYFK